MTGVRLDSFCLVESDNDTRAAAGSALMRVVLYFVLLLVLLVLLLLLLTLGLGNIILLRSRSETDALVGTSSGELWLSRI